MRPHYLAPTPPQRAPRPKLAGQITGQAYRQTIGRPRVGTAWSINSISFTRLDTYGVPATIIYLRLWIGGNLIQQISFNSDAPVPETQIIQFQTPYTVFDTEQVEVDWTLLLNLRYAAQLSYL